MKNVLKQTKGISTRHNPSVRIKDSTVGITLIALVITIIVLLILAGVTIETLTGENGILTQASKAKDKTAEAEAIERVQLEVAGSYGMDGEIDIDNLNDNLKSNISGLTYNGNPITEKEAENENRIENLPALVTLNGYDIVIDGNGSVTKKVAVIADGSWNGTVNTPKIEGTGLTAVYWNGTQWVKLTLTSSEEEWNNWYDYSKKEWANAQSADGSMWVWIPRYEYKIDTTNKTISVNFVQIGESTTSGYTLHPAFTTELDNGGWNKELSGFWVAKYAAGYQNATVGEDTKTVQYSNLPYTELNGYTSNFLETTLTKDTTKLSYPVFKANTYAYNIISAGDAWLLSQEIDTASMYGLSNVDSHMEKNSEWGAVAYLTHSQYGVNGNSTNMNEVVINNKNLNNTIYVNNATSGTKANVYAITSYANNNTPNDVSASSTKNMTGVFDLNGCVWERVAGFYKGGSASTSTWHSAMASSSTSSSSKYLTLYTTNNKKGDATNETAGWNSDYSYFVTSSSPVFARGGYYNVGDGAGVFAFSASNGYPHYYSGFRVCLAF